MIVTATSMARGIIFVLKRLRSTGVFITAIHAIKQAMSSIPFLKIRTGVDLLATMPAIKGAGISPRPRIV